MFQSARTAARTLAVAAAVSGGAILPAAAQEVPATATATGSVLPPALMHDGRPLDPFCFQPGAADGPVEVTACRPDDIVADGDGAAAPDERGWIGLTYRYADMPEDSVRGWIAWRPVGETDRGHVVETYDAAGGTGQFTSVTVVRREGDTLVPVETLAGGDRCNGGIAAAAVADGSVVLSVSLTPYDLLALAYGEAGPPVDPYGDIAACAICCAGAATVVDGALAWVTLDPLPDDGFAAEDQPAQACLDALLRDRPQILTPRALALLAHDFGTTCLPVPASGGQQ